MSTSSNTPPSFISSHGELARLEACFNNGQPCLVVGDSGYGKTTAVHTAAATCGFDVVTVIGGGHLVAGDLVGRYHLAAHGSVFKPGPLTTAIRRAQRSDRGIVFFVDELAELSVDVLLLLYPLLDDRRQLIAPVLKRPLQAPPNFAFCGAMNPRADRQANTLPRALLGRCHMVEVRPLPMDKEIELICERTGLSRPLARNLVDCAHATRHMAESSIAAGVSTRQVLRAARELVQGHPIEAVLDANFILPLASDRKVQDRLRATLMFHWDVAERELSPSPEEVDDDTFESEVDLEEVA